LADISVFPKNGAASWRIIPIGRSLIHYRSVAPDRTRKYLLKLADGLIIEAVGIPSEKD
jgi:23S rRNA (adenine2503-C2)-methyltransferase